MLQFEVHNYEEFKDTLKTNHIIIGEKIDNSVVPVIGGYIYKLKEPEEKFILILASDNETIDVNTFTAMAISNVLYDDIKIRIYETNQLEMIYNLIKECYLFAIYNIPQSQF